MALDLEEFIKMSVIAMPQIHAHICKKCLSDGVEQIWIHEDLKRGDIQAHTCPRCGTVEWQKFMVPVGQLPGRPQQQQLSAFEVFNAILVSMFWISAILLLLFIAWQMFKTNKVAVPK